MKITRLNRCLFPAAAMLAAVTLLAACDGGASSDTPSATRTATSSPTSSSSDDVLDDIQASNSAARESLEAEVSEAAESAEPEMPDVVGMNHSEALALLHSKGFLVDEEDASSEGRWVIDNSNWKVCRQDPAPGATDEIRVAIYSVKLDESC
ncbi:PASTA domain-containing protein [Streptomyces bottropensis]|nr:PASTA domain-containing protein [Streptomyces bottropensis]MZD16984.1 PASTA domain-containing protein [Streptomyces sp. SID5476]